MKTTFTYYKREYELIFDGKAGEGHIAWEDGMYYESRSFYVNNGTIQLRGQGKMARQASKAWGKCKTDAIKAIILEHISLEDGE